MGNQIGEVLELHRGMKRKAARDRAMELMRMVASPTRHAASELPSRCRAAWPSASAIAMALACEPELLIADEPSRPRSTSPSRPVILDPA
ncbi:MAG: hypothetical protein R3C32_08910 [Chloroflexota bacterium]